MKKNGGHMASDLELSNSGLYKRSVIDPVTFRFKLEGTFGISTDCQKLTSISQVQRPNSLLAQFWRSANILEVIEPVTPRFSPEGTFGISTRLPEAGLHQSSGKAKLTTGPVLEVSKFPRGC